MSADEIKEAFLSGQAVEFNGNQYASITAVIYRKVKQGVIVSAELLDRARNSVTIAEAKRVNRICT